VTDWDKTDIIHFLSDLHGYQSYLELCTPTTGALYHKIDRSKFRTCHRLMYRCSPSFDDQMDVNFRSPHMGTKDLIETIHAFGLRYDIVLVDSFHLYDSSYRDVADAFSLMTDRGATVVHDCLPPSEDLVSGEFVPGSWCGVSFLAFVDFVQNTTGLAYRTVDTDFGCGVIRKTDAEQVSAAKESLKQDWARVRHDPKEAYRFMMENKVPLLNLLSVDEFRQAELNHPPSR
jgi:hypothetical protein